MNNKKSFTGLQKAIILMMMLIMITFLGITAILVSNGENENVVRTRGNSKTMMIYMTGSDLESDSGVATGELRSIVPSDIDLSNINILIYTGGSKIWHNPKIKADENAIYKVTLDGLEKVASYKTKSMGDASTLTDFLIYGYNNYKADSYDLAIWDHGAGILGSSFDELFKDDFINISEFKTALEKSPFNKKNKLESVIFMTCLNGNLELASLFSDYAYYMVASEEVSMGSSSHGVFGFLGNIDKSSYGNEVGKAYIDSYQEYIELVNSHGAKNDSTYSIIDLTKISKLNEKINSLFNKINPSKDFVSLARMRSSMHQYGTLNNSGTTLYDTVDLYELISNLRDYSPKDVDDILNYLKNEVVVYNFALNEHSNGLSIYFPFNGSNYYKSMHLNLYSSLNISNNYKRFVQDFNKAQTSTAYNFASDISDNEIEFSGSQVRFKLEGNQKINYLNSSYMILKKVNDDYEVVYKGTDSKLEGNYAVAGITKKLIKVVNDNNGTESIIEVEKNTKDNEYGTYLKLYNENYDKDASMTIYFDETNSSKKYDISLLSSLSDGIMASTGIFADINDYNKFDFKIEKYHIFNSSNEYIDDWYDNMEEETYRVEGNNFHFEKVDYNKDEYYFVFVVKDIQNNDYYSKLIELK